MDAAVLEAIERDATLDQWRAAPDELRVRLALGWWEVDGALLTRVERIDNDWHNRVLGLGMEKPASRRLLEQMVGAFRAAGSKHFSIQLAPGAQPAELRSWLAELGLQPSVRIAKLVRPAGETVEISGDLRVAEVEARDAAAFGRVSCAGWGLPPPLIGWLAALVGRDRWRCYLAWDGAEPIAAAVLYFDGDLVWAGGAVTLQQHRGRGAQSALIARAIADAGRATLVAETLEDNQSFRNCLKLGFQRAYVRESFTQSASK
jgi:Acetyltransferase (GNAT) family